MIFSNNRFETITSFCKGRVLDIGAAEGGLHEYISHRIKSIRSMDIREADVMHNADVFPYPFKNNSFNTIVAGEIIEHLNSPFDFLIECRRILKPMGTLIITTPNARMLMPYSNIEENDKGYELHKYLWDMGTLLRLVRTAGLQIADHGYVNTYQKNIIFKMICAIFPQLSWHLVVVAKKK